MKSVIEATTGNGSFAALGADERRMILLVLAGEDARGVETAVREEAAIDSETILTQADEALVLG